MKTPTALRWLPALIVAALAGAPAASAQEPDDFSFARRLAYRGWFDLAGDVCARIERDHSLPRDARSSLPILNAEIELAKADRETDLEKAGKHIGEAISRLRKFIADEPNHPRIYEAHINIGYLKLRKAKSLVDRMEGAKSGDEHDRLKQEATTLYREVTEDFEKLAQDWKRIQPSTPEIDGSIMDARLEANRARYELAKVPGLEPVERKKLLEDAVKNLVDFEIDYGDTAKAFEAMLIEGRSLLELGENAQAETKFKNTMALDEILRKEKIARNGYFEQIIYGAYLSMAQLYLKTNRPRECRVFIEATFRNDPAAERDWAGPALKVELVDALFRLKENTLARALADKVIAADPNGPFAQRMKDRLGSARVGGGRVPPDQAVLFAESSIGKGRLREAMITLRQALESSTTEDARAKYAPRALFLMGQCLQEMRRNYEAAIVYEKLFSQFPSHELAVKGCWEAIVCYSNEFDTFKDPQDGREKDRLMETLVSKWPGAKEGDNIPYLQGLNLENARKPKEAADKYFKVPERAPAYERSLVRGAYCLRFDAFRQYSDLLRKKVADPAAEKAIIEQLGRAEEHFKQFLNRVESGKFPTNSPEEARDRASLVIVVNQELAYIYNHKLIGKAKEALAFLDKVAKDIPPDDDRMARIHHLQIQSQLVLNMNEEAVKTLELMFDRFRDTEVTAQACKSVGIRLDEITRDHIDKRKKAGQNDLDEISKENLKKINKYYDTWLKGAMSYSMNVTVSDVMAVAETLYHNAKRLNNLPDEVQSFMDLKKNIVAWKNYFDEAEYVHALLVSGQFRDKVPPKELPTLMIRRARCLSFIADQSETWLSAKTAYETLIRHFGVEDAKGNFISKAVIDRPVLLGPYLELGHVYFELGRLNRIHYDNAITVFSNVVSVSAPASEPWWIARFMIAQAHYRRGQNKDIMTAKTMIKMLRDNYPNFDENKYGLKDRFEELEKQIASGGH